jgi:UPF0716 protein FxsA
MPLFILFIIVPFTELFILVRLGMYIGFWETILIQVITAAVGASLARHQGFRIWMGIQQDLANGQMPAEKLIDGFLILCAGLVLLTPGLLTDFFGLIVLIPLTRNLIKKWLVGRFEKMRDQRKVSVTYILK